jgi:hypothetical protein
MAVLNYLSLGNWSTLEAADIKTATTRGDKTIVVTLRLHPRCWVVSKQRTLDGLIACWFMLFCFMIN